MIKNTGCPSGRPEFSSQNPYGGSQPSTPGDLGPSDTHTSILHVQTKYSYIDKINTKENIPMTFKREVWAGHGNQKLSANLKYVSYRVDVVACAFHPSI